MKKMMALAAIVGSPLALALPSALPKFGVLLLILNLRLFEQTLEIFYTLLTASAGIIAATGSAFFLSL